MGNKEKTKYTVFHWDTFDNETISMGEFGTLKEAESFVNKYYANRIRSNGADVVTIRDQWNHIYSRYSVG